MRIDDAGVGGFAEDLPVMVFVLAGVSLLVGSAVNAVAEVRAVGDGDLEATAELLVSAVLRSAQSLETPTIQWLRSSDLDRCVRDVAAGCNGFFLSIRMVHPTVEQLQSVGALPEMFPGMTGSCSRFLNAEADDMLITVVEVRAVVW